MFDSWSNNYLAEDELYSSLSLSLTIKYTQIREVICAQGWGLFLPLVGQWSWLCTHILPVFPISSNSLCLVGETLQLADSTPYLFLSLSSLVSVSFLKTLFRVVFLHKSQSHTKVGKTSFWKQWRDAGIFLVFMSLHVWHIFLIPHSIFRSTLNSYSIYRGGEWPNRTHRVNYLSKLFKSWHKESNISHCCVWKLIACF